MKTMYYSEITDKYYDSVEKLEAAEKKIEDAKKEEKKKAAERKERANEIAKAYEDLKAAQDKYNDLVNKFIDDYGRYNVTYTGTIKPVADIFDLIDKILF